MMAFSSLGGVLVLVLSVDWGIIKGGALMVAFLVEWSIIEAGLRELFESLPSAARRVDSKVFFVVAISTITHHSILCNGQGCNGGILGLMGHNDAVTGKMFEVLALAAREVLWKKFLSLLQSLSTSFHSLKWWGSHSNILGLMGHQSWQESIFEDDSIFHVIIRPIGHHILGKITLVQHNKRALVATIVDALASGNIVFTHARGQNTALGEVPLGWESWLVGCCGGW